HQIFPDDQTVELALAVYPFAKYVRQLSEPVGRRSRGKEVQKNFETLPGQPSRSALEGMPMQHKEPAHRVSDLGGDNESSEPSRNTAHHCAALVPVADRAPCHVATADDDIEPIGFEGCEHSRQQLFVMLQIGVDDCEVRGAAREHALDHGS